MRGSSDDLAALLTRNMQARTPVDERFAASPPESRRAWALRQGLRLALGKRFATLARVLQRNGCVILEGGLEEDSLMQMRQLFERGARSKEIDWLGQLSFNGAVDGDLGDLRGLDDLATDPLIQLLAADGLGGIPKISNWRGYRLEPRDPILYRAWDWHVDQKRAEVKAMVLLTDVPPDGQPMQYIPGSHRQAWRLRCQRETKFDMDEALMTGDRPAVISCHGPAGTIVVFESTGVHRGIRSLVARRDAITISFVPDESDAPVFPGRLGTASALNHNRPWAALAPAAHARRWREARLVAAAALAGPAVRRSLSSLQPAHQELTAAQLQRCREDYAVTPGYQDFKPRLGGASLDGFLAEHPTVDLLADLDLPLWPGATDVARDIQLVKLRDAAHHDRQPRELARRFGRAAALTSATLPRATAPRECVLRVGAAVDAALERAPTTRELAQVGELMRDLRIAVNHLDSMQRARTTLAYTVANGVNCLLLLRNWGRGDDEAEADLEDAVDRAATLYAGLVAFEDLGLAAA